jgi:nucleoside-diphosphate-sugar epimerase
MTKGLLITGGNGYLGTTLARRAAREGYPVYVLDRTKAEPGTLPAGVIDLVGDIREPDGWEHVFGHVGAVAHLAAVVGDAAGSLNPDDTWATNYLGTVNVAEACRWHGVRRLVFASTCSNYGASRAPTADIWSPVDPQSEYARTKTLAEHYLLSVRDALFEPRILRFATLHGLSPRMRFDLVVNRMTAAAVQDGVIEVHGGAQWRPFLHVDDAAEAILAALAMPSTSHAVLNCGSSTENYRIADIAELVLDAVPEARIEVTPPGGDRRDYRVDFEPIRRELGFLSRRSVPDSIRELAVSLRDGRFPDYRHQRYHNHPIGVRGVGEKEVQAA